jgi:glycosyltransferase involved in cell wall biosynthesis
MDQVPIICNSEHTKRLLKSRFPTANIVGVVYPGIDLDKFKPTWKDRRYLFYHSRYDPRKNQMLLIEIASYIKYPLLLAGYLDKRFKDYYTQLTTKAPSNVTILTNLSDEEILSYLQKCSVYLFPALNEHFGIAIVEAMACGKPVIGHNSGATSEVIDDAGYVCGDNHKEWIEKIDLLMKNQELRADLSKKAYQRAQKFGWENMVSTLEKIFYSYLQ